MLLGLRAIGSAFRQVGGRFMLSLGGNVTAIALSIPLLAAVFLLAFLFHSLSFVPFGVAVLVGVMPNPAAIGLQMLAREMAYDRFPELNDQWRGLRDYWRLALKAWLISAGITAICFLNVVFYASRSATSSSGLSGLAGPLYVVWGVMLVFWLGMHLYVGPLLLAQEKPGIRLAYRNAAVLTVSRPFASWTAILVWFAVLAISSATGLATIIGLTLAAAIQQNTLRLLLPTFSPPV
jgi:hypothetical protein